ncbi:MAG TPA: histidine phosphatase family protein [Planctomycetota bacterium]|nr:histidine phosphatase family protein [Planctomycetota bacterium]
MSEQSPLIGLARHGQTAWSLSGQHTGRTDIPLTPAGEQAAAKLGGRLRSLGITTVFTSPLQRAKKTCEICGFGAIAAVIDDLQEWNYGEYEGLRSAEIRARRSDWRIFRDGCPGGEHLEDVVVRADRVVALLKSVRGNAVVFSHGHFLRVLMARWVGIAPDTGAHFSLDPASLSFLSIDPHSGDPVVERWNDVAHLSP